MEEGVSSKVPSHPAAQFELLKSRFLGTLNEKRFNKANPLLFQLKQYQMFCVPLYKYIMVQGTPSMC